MRLEDASEQELLASLREQRWFGAKELEAVGLKMLDEAVLHGDPPLIDGLVEVRYSTGSHGIFQLIVSPRDESAPGKAIASRGSDKLVDVLSDASCAHRLIELIANETSIEAREGIVEFQCGTGEIATVPGREARSLEVEQSNSSVVVDDRSILKVYRRLEAGVNPELEMLRFLGLRGFANVPALQGWWSYSSSPLTVTLGIAQAFVPGAQDGWTLALAELADQPEIFLSRLEDLGETIGTMHRTLASDPEDVAFAPEDPTPETLALFAATLDDEVDDLFRSLDEDLLAPIADLGDLTRGLSERVTSVSSIGRLIRNHGDLHLGQVLAENGRWVVIDFEGEPARSTAERRRKRSPLRDVAGMLRSFAYATAVSGAPANLEERARTSFLNGYRQATEGTSFVPVSSSEADQLLSFFELEKAIYELRYELAHRPGWVGVPVAGIARLMERAAS